ncbi:MAG: tetraprenyl-beta-curcumene synthase [Solirubrobacterales bacterium]|nr:tetraprenyl-beta-curcumene synthase [Solirubrobacterales bacterium]
MLATLSVYRARVLPAVHRELASWRQFADGIPDPTLRRSAISALTDKDSNAEATAVLATLAPRQTRRTVVRASTALQVAIDYLDTLGEQEVPDPLRDGLRLHTALSAALTPGAEPIDWYLHHAQQLDGGYLNRLVAVCQESVSALPSREAILPFARRAARRCGEGQSHTHAAVLATGGELEAWASGQAVPAEFPWWEVAAGASSSVAAHALLALAGDPGATAAEAEAVDAAYFPSIGALTVILDDLVDRDADELASEHSYLHYYPNATRAAERMALIATGARARTGSLRHARRHAAILAGVVAFYLSSPRTDAALAASTRRRLLTSAGPMARPLAALLRVRGND